MNNGVGKKHCDMREQLLPTFNILSNCPTDVAISDVVVLMEVVQHCGNAVESVEHPLLRA